MPFVTEWADETQKMNGHTPGWSDVVLFRSDMRTTLGTRLCTISDSGFHNPDHNMHDPSNGGLCRSSQNGQTKQPKCQTRHSHTTFGEEGKIPHPGHGSTLVSGVL